jgi:hypothetical protein
METWPPARQTGFHADRESLVVHNRIDPPSRAVHYGKFVRWEPATTIEATWEAVVVTHRSMLRRFVLRLTRGDEVHAERVVRETFYRVAQDLRRFVGRAPTLRPRLVLLACRVVQEREWFAPAGHDDRPVVPRW